MKAELPVSHRDKTLGIATTAQPIDSGILLSRCMGNASFALTLLAELEANGKQQVDSIARLVANAEPHTVAQEAHSLKGAAAIIGAEQLRGKAAEIEAAARDGGTSLLLDMVHDLRSEMIRCLAYIPIFRAETLRR